MSTIQQKQSKIRRNPEKEYQECFDLDLLGKIIKSFSSLYDHKLCNSFKEYRDGKYAKINRENAIKQLENLFVSRMKKGFGMKYRRPGGATEGTRRFSKEIGMQGLSKVLRHTLCVLEMLDVDIANCHVEIFLSLLRKEGLFEVASDIQYYVDNRVRCREELARYLECDVETAKTTLLKYLNDHVGGVEDTIRKFTFENGAPPEWFVKYLECWRSSIHRKTYEKVVHDPSFSHHENAINIAKHFTITADDCPTQEEKSDEEVMEEIRPFYEHILNVWADKDPSKANLILQIMAWMLQKPTEKTGIFLSLIKTKQGIGKDIISLLLKKILGDDYVLNLSSFDALTDKLNGNLAGALLVILNEALFAGNKQQSQIIKDFTTCPTFPLRKLYCNPITVPNTMQFFCYTNNNRDIHRDMSDRRGFILVPNEDHMQWDEAKREAYFDKVCDTSPLMIATYLYRMKLPNKLRNIRTKALDDMKILSMDPPVQFVHHLLTDNEMINRLTCANNEFGISELYKFYSEFFESNCKGSKFNSMGTIHEFSDLFWNQFISGTCYSFKKSSKKYKFLKTQQELSKSWFERNNMEIEDDDINEKHSLENHPEEEERIKKSPKKN